MSKQLSCQWFQIPLGSYNVIIKDQVYIFWEICKCETHIRALLAVHLYILWSQLCAYLPTFLCVYERQR